MTQSEIVAFFEIIKAGSISAASEALFVSQPALSRRIHTLEAELGYSLFIRNKGQKKIELTTKGKAFVPVARRMLDAWKDALSINQLDTSDILNLSAIDSISKYILPDVFRQLSMESENIRICFHNYHSFEAYDYISREMADIALISDDRYYKDIETIPLFQEPMILLCNRTMDCPESVSPEVLSPDREILLPWSPEFDTWHDYWFGSDSRYHSFVDQMGLLEYLLSWKNTWAIAPASVAGAISAQDYVTVHKLTSPPPDRIIYYIKRANTELKYEAIFFRTFYKCVKKIPDLVWLNPE